MPLPWAVLLVAGALAAGLLARELRTLPSWLPAVSAAQGSARADSLAEEEARSLAAARRELRAEAARSVRAALDPVFAAMKARIPAYADWYYSYPTKYLLMAHAFVAATDYTAASLVHGGPSAAGLVAAIKAHLSAYMDAQYRARVVRPQATEASLAAAFAQADRALARRWARLRPGGDGAGGASPAAWAPRLAAEPGIGAARGDKDRFTGVVVGLFSELAAPVAAEAQSLALSLATGGAAAAAPPAAGILGLAATIGIGILANGLDERLTGAAFEDKISRAISATQTEIDARMNALLDRRIDIWYAQALRPYRRAGQIARGCCRPHEG